MRLLFFFTLGHSSSTYSELPLKTPSQSQHWGDGTHGLPTHARDLEGELSAPAAGALVIRGPGLLPENPSTNCIFLLCPPISDE